MKPTEVDIPYLANLKKQPLWFNTLIQFTYKRSVNYMSSSKKTNYLTIHNYKNIKLNHTHRSRQISLEQMMNSISQRSHSLNLNLLSRPKFGIHIKTICGITFPNGKWKPMFLVCGWVLKTHHNTQYNQLQSYKYFI